jgi:hypothetical protein
LQLRGMRQQVPRLTQQVEPDVGKRQILFQRGRMADPLAETLRENQAGVADRERVTPHRFFTSAGIS